MKKNITDFDKMKLASEKVTWITAYDYPFALSAEKAGIDMILIGDSGGMVQLGYKTTNPVTMDEMITMAKSVRKGAPNTFIVGDMPQGSYEVSNEEAVRNALRFVKEAGCDSIKLEGGLRVCERVVAIMQAGIIVIGHLGLTPQSTASFGGYKVQGKNKKGFEKTLEDALFLEQSGASILLLEAMPEAPAEQIAKQLNIPVYGIGAGQKVDGQLVIMHDLMGFYQEFRPWFAKCYLPDVIGEFDTYIKSIEGSLKAYGRTTRQDGLLYLAELSIKRYIDEVRSGKFPDTEYIYPIKEEELKDLQSSESWRIL